MNWNPISDDSRRPSQQAARDNEERVPSDRLAQRAGRRASSRPPVDPDLERFLTSMGQPTPTTRTRTDNKPADASAKRAENPDAFLSWTTIHETTRSSEEPVEVIVPEEVGPQHEENRLPRWEKIDTHSARSQTRMDAKSVALVPTHRDFEPLFAQVPLRKKSPDMVMRRVYRRLPLAILVAVTVWSLATLFVVMTPRTYQAESTLIIDTETFREEASKLRDLGVDVSPYSASKLPNHTLVISSSTELSERVGQRIAAMHASGELANEWTIFSELAKRAPQGESLSSLLRNDYIVVEGTDGDDDQPDAVAIKVKSSNPREAAAIADVYATLYVNDLNNTFPQRISEAIRRQQDRVLTRESDLESLRAEQQALGEGGATIYSRDESSYLYEQLAKLQEDLDATQIALQGFRATMASLESEMETMMPQLRADRDAHGIEDQIDKMYARIASINVEAERYYAKNPELRDDPSPSRDLSDLLRERTQLNRQADSLSTQYADAITSVGGIDLRSYDGTISYMARLRRSLIETQVQIDGAEARESAILNRMVQYETLASKQPSLQVEQERLRIQLEDARNEYSELQGELTDLEKAAATKAILASVLSPATVPSQPVMSSTYLLLLGLILGGLMAAGAVIVAERFDTRVFETEDYEREGADVIASIPHLKRPISGKSVRLGNRSIDSRLVALYRPHSPASSPFTSLTVQLSGGRLNHGVFCFVGMNRGSGTSLIAANTASVWATSGARVLLLDADSLHGSVWHRFGIQDGKGLENGHLQSEHFSLTPFSPDMPNFLLGKARTSTDANTQVLLAKRLPLLLDTIREHFDAIIIDAPALSTSTLALGLSRRADATVLVSRSGDTHAPNLAQVVSDISRLSGDVPKLIINRLGSHRL